MKKTSAELKRIARENMRGHWGLMIGVYVLETLIMYAAFLPCYFLFYFFDIITNSVVLALIFLPVMLIVALAASILAAGVMGMHVKIARGQDISLGGMFSQFVNRPWRYILGNLLLGLIAFACIIPGGICIGVGIGMEQSVAVIIGAVLYIAGFVLCIWVMFHYILTNYLFFDNPEMGVITAFKESSRLMKGNKGRMFYISLSFIGWTVLGMLSCGIGMLWVSPYMAQTNAQFYLNVKEIGKQEEEQE